MKPPNTPMVLVILDGFGYRQETAHNAIAQAHTPHWDSLWQHKPHLLIDGSGQAVGLPEGQMGNSEVGHLSLGSGRAIPQDYTRINQAISDGEFQNNLILLEGIKQAIAAKKAIHLLGLLSPGGVHSHEDQLFAMIKLCAQQGASPVYVHAFLDGRDTPPKSAANSLVKLEQIFAECKQKRGIQGGIASITGRYYAMDRDHRWDRIQQCYDLLTIAKTPYVYHSAEAALEAAYGREETDEFVQASGILIDQQQPVIADGDTVIFMNYRADRARELSQALWDKNFSHFNRKPLQLGRFITLTEYAKGLHAQVAFPPLQPSNTLGDVIAQKGWKQCRLAETEKYAHVTYFFNGGREQPLPGEERILIPSPKVATYDLQPEMNAAELTNKLVATIESKDFALIVCNYANPDMVGHTGNFAATIKAIDIIDQCLGRIISAVETSESQLLITADHGNAENMFNHVTQQAHTAHTTEPVPLVYVGNPVRATQARGCLADVAPTILHLLSLTIPEEMTGNILFESL